MTAPTLTVAICTYNRADSLRRTLESLAAQVGVDFASVEVLIVDNNSRDATAAVVDALADRLPLRRVVETQQGLSHARNRALAEFRGDVLISTDDDVRLTPDWLAAYRAAFAAFPDAAYFGGRIVPDWNGDRPGWVREPCLHLLDGVLVWFDRGMETRPFAAAEPTPFGASFALRRSAIAAAGAFRADLGTGGSGLGRGEETDYLNRIKAAGGTGVYVGRALCYHAVDPRRLKLAALYRHGKASGASHRAMNGGTAAGSVVSAGLYFARGLAQLARGRGDRFRQCVINAGIVMGTRSDLHSRQGRG